MGKNKKIRKQLLKYDSLETILDDDGLCAMLNSLPEDHVEKVVKKFNKRKKEKSPYSKIARKIEFEDIDVSSNEDARKDMVEKSGQMGVPVLDIDGKIIVGFDQQAIEKELAK